MSMQAPYSNEWDAAAPQARGSTRAAVLLWVLAGLEIVVGGFLAMGMAVMAQVPAGEWPGQLLEQGMSEAMLRAVMKGMAVAMILTGVVPGVIYLVTAFGVMRGRPAAIITAMIVALTQALVIGLFLLNILLNLTRLNPQDLTVAVIVLGTPLAMLVAVLMLLWRAKTGGGIEAGSGV